MHTICKHRDTYYGGNIRRREHFLTAHFLTTTQPQPDDQPDVVEWCRKRRVQQISLPGLKFRVSVEEPLEQAPLDPGPPLHTRCKSVQAQIALPLVWSNARLESKPKDNEYEIEWKMVHSPTSDAVATLHVTALGVLRA